MKWERRPFRKLEGVIEIIKFAAIQNASNDSNPINGFSEEKKSHNNMQTILLTKKGQISQYKVHEQLQ